MPQNVNMCQESFERVANLRQNFPPTWSSLYPHYYLGLEELMPKKTPFTGEESKIFHQCQVLLVAFVQASDQYQKVLAFTKKRTKHEIAA